MLFQTVRDGDEVQTNQKDIQIKALIQEKEDFKSQIVSLNKEKEFIKAKLNVLIKKYTNTIAEIDRIKQSFSSNSSNTSNKN